MTILSKRDRRTDIDALRVGAFALLILYHAGMPFSGWGWHIDDVTWPALKEVMLFMNRWRMSLVFFVAGAGIMLALGRRGPGAFAAERLTRLGIPLLFGMAVIVPPQVWAERSAEGAFAGGYLAFLPHAFDGVYPVGNLSWHHLWFLAYALTLSLLLLPLFLALRSDRGGEVLDRLSGRVGAPVLLWLLIVPSLLVNIVEPWWIPGNDNALLGDWYGLSNYGLVLLIGAVIYRGPFLATAVERGRWVHLAIGIAAYALFRFYFLPHRAAVADSMLLHVLYVATKTVNAYAVILALAGFARRHLSGIRSPWLAYATEAVFPFYVLHQTITVLAAYALLDSPLPVPAKFAVLVVVTFGGCWLLYEGAVRRLGMFRVIFGLKQTETGPRFGVLLRRKTVTWA